MRKVLTALFAASIALSMPVAAAATHSPSGDNPPRDFAVGHGDQLQTGISDLAFAATSGPLGEDARGHLRFRDFTGDVLSGVVTCLLVVGRVAVVGAYDREQDRHIFVRAFDTAPPGDNDEAIFGFGAVGAGPPTHQSCVEAVIAPPGNAVDGKITVHDGQPNVTE
jgi:hypothetical protein